MAKKDTTVQSIPEQALTNAQLAAPLPLALTNEYESESGQGFENADIDSFAIPFLSILQDLSPQADKKNAEQFIKGAVSGMFFNSVTQEVHDGDVGLVILPCYYKRVFLNWKKRSDGGGFLGEYLPTHPIVSQTTRTEAGDELSNGTLLVDTRVHYVLILGGEAGPQPAVISLSSTQVKKSKQWMSRMECLKLRRGDGSLFTPPMYAHTWLASANPERNDQGSWYGWKFESPKLQTNPIVKQAAQEFLRSLTAGDTKEQYETPASAVPNEHEVEM